MTAADVQTTDDARRSAHDEPPYRIVIDEKHYTVEHRFRTGTQLKDLAGIPAANHLFLEVPGPADDDPIADDFSVPMQDGLRFYDVPVGNLGGR
jgi:hypothetical protein